MKKLIVDLMVKLHDIEHIFLILIKMFQILELKTNLNTVDKHDIIESTEDLWPPE